MDKIQQHYVPHLEWEVLDHHEITHLECLHGIYTLPSDCAITFQRDGDYGFLGYLSGIVTDSEVLEPSDKDTADGFLKHEVIRGYSVDRTYQYEFHGFYIKSHTSRPVTVASGFLVQFKAEIQFDYVVRTPMYGKAAENKVQEWFLSSKLDIWFPRSTRREYHGMAYRFRGGVDDESVRRQPVEKSSSSGRDFFKVKYKEFEFMVARVPKEFGPEWSYNVCIEYRESLGGIPIETTRKAIAEFVGFIIGSHLLGIGFTSYSVADNFVKQHYDRSWVINARHSCEKRHFGPIRFRGTNDPSRIEDILNALLPNYIRLREELRLDIVLAKYWVSSTIYLGENLPVLSSAIEMLADAVLKQHREFKQYYIE